VGLSNVAVTQLTAGSRISLSPAGGTGNVTVTGDTPSDWASYTANTTVKLGGNSISNNAASTDFVVGNNGINFYNNSGPGTYNYAPVNAGYITLAASNSGGNTYIFADGVGYNVSGSKQAAILYNGNTFGLASLYISSLYLGNFGGTITGQLTTDSTASTIMWNNDILLTKSNLGSNTHIYTSSLTLMVAVGSDIGGALSSIQTSIDGFNWRSIESGGFIDAYDVAWNGSYWLAAGDNGVTLSSIQKSADGISWTGITSGGFCNYAKGVTWNSSYWVAVGDDRGGALSSIQTSVDGINWTGITSGGFDTFGAKTAWNGSYWVATGQDVTGGTASSIQTSVDGINWLGITHGGFITNGLDVEWNGSYWVAVGQGGDTIQTSSDGLFWTGPTSGGFDSYGSAVAWNGSLWVAVGRDVAGGALSSIQTSTDGNNWTGITTGGFSFAGNGITWNGSYWIAVGNDSTSSLSNIQVSVDGTNWTGITSGGFNSPSYAGYSVASATQSYLGINCNSPRYTLDVNGTINAPSAILNDIFYANTHLISDRRTKKNIVSADLTQCYSTLRELPLRRFEFLNPINELKQDKKQVGFIADEIQSFFPKAIKPHQYNKNGFSTLNFVNFEQIHMTHFGATKYMASLLDNQHSTIVGQNADISTLKNKFMEQTSEISSLQLQVSGFSNVLSTILAKL